MTHTVTSQNIDDRWKVNVAWPKYEAKSNKGEIHIVFMEVFVDQYKT
jgi:hypothetical protein